MATTRNDRTIRTLNVLIMAVLLLAGLGAGTAFSAESQLRRFQGVIMDRQGATLIVNEEPLAVTRGTRIMSMDRSPSSAARLVPGQWVAVEAEKTVNGQQARTIILLPKRVEGADLRLFTDQSDE